MSHRGVELRAFMSYCRFIAACTDEGWNTVQYSSVMQLKLSSGTLYNIHGLVHYHSNQALQASMEWAKMMQATLIDYRQ